MESWKLKLKVGDKVRVARNESGHGFKIGSEVKIKIIWDYGYACEGDTGLSRYFYPEDIGEIEKLVVAYNHVIPNSHGWTDLTQLLECLKSDQTTVDYIRAGIENTLKAGYNLKKTVE